MTSENGAGADKTIVLAQIDALFDDLAEHEDSQQLSRLDAIADAYLPQAVASVRRMLSGVSRHADFFAQPAAARMLQDEHFKPGDQIGRWQIDGELGRGGQAVALAVTRLEGGFEQHAVLKLPLGSPPSSDAVRRLLRERQMLATLKHPGLPGLIDGGVRDDGTPYLVIERIQGLPIDQYVDTHIRSVSERVALIRQIAQIVAHAHAQLILHRDIKPANILIDTSGRAVLLDFGVAQSLKPQDTATSSGYTLAYAAPEQVRGERCSAATDVYGLTALACRVLTGEGPFAGMPASAQLRAVLEDNPNLPTSLDRDLAAILQRGLRKEPETRYASVAELDAELQRWQSSLPVLAHSGGRRYRLGKWLRRWRAAVAVAAILLVTTSAALWQAQRAKGFAEVAERERRSAISELRRQEMLQEHYANVFNRLLESGEAIAPDTLIDGLADIRITAASNDAATQRAITMAVADLQLTRGEYVKTIETLKPLNESSSDLSPWEQVGLAETLATALNRLGKPDEADEALKPGESAVPLVPDSRKQLAKASLAVIRAQVLRSQGKLPESLTMARSAIESVAGNTEVGPMRLGQIYINCSLTAMYAGDILLARQWGDQGQTIWQSAGLTDMVSYQTSSSNLASLDIVAGDPGKALARFEAIEANASASENSTAREARRLLMARALAHLGRRDRALNMVSESGDAFCRLLGEDTADCVRARLAGADLSNWFHDASLAAQFLDRVRQPDAPAIAAAFHGMRSMQQLNESPTSAHLQAVDTILTAQAAQPGLGRRVAFRQRMGAAERLRSAGHDKLARQLMAPLVDDPALTDQVEGMDRVRLKLWQADHAGVLPQQIGLVDELARLLGPDHPSVATWRAWVAG